MSGWQIKFKFLIFSALTILCLGDCFGENPYRPRKGDILFQGMGTSAFSQSIAGSTSKAGEDFRPIHVAMVVQADSLPQRTMLLEADPDRGVCLTTLSDFLENTARTDAGKPKAIVKRLSSEKVNENGCYGFDSLESLIDSAVSRSLTYLGRPYDWLFLADNEPIYCSELIQLSYLGIKGEKLFPMEPLNFKGADGKIMSYWIELYKRQNHPVPQGLPGSSPKGQMDNGLLETVYDFR